MIHAKMASCDILCWNVVLGNLALGYASVLVTQPVTLYNFMEGQITVVVVPKIGIGQVWLGACWGMLLSRRLHSFQGQKKESYSLYK